MAKATSTVTTKDGAWTTLATGECTVASLIANATVSTTLVSLRVTLSGGTNSYILPLNTLQSNTPNRMATGIKEQMAQLFDPVCKFPIGRYYNT